MAKKYTTEGSGVAMRNMGLSHHPRHFADGGSVDDQPSADMPRPRVGPFAEDAQFSTRPRVGPFPRSVPLKNSDRSRKKGD